VVTAIAQGVESPGEFAPVIWNSLIRLLRSSSLLSPQTEFIAFPVEGDAAIQGP